MRAPTNHTKAVAMGFGEAPSYLLNPAGPATSPVDPAAARFRLLANALPGIVWTAAPDGTITYASDSWFHYCGVTPDENARGWPELVEWMNRVHELAPAAC